MAGQTLHSTATVIAHLFVDGIMRDEKSSYQQPIANPANLLKPQTFPDVIAELAPSQQIAQSLKSILKPLAICITLDSKIAQLKAAPYTLPDLHGTLFAIIAGRKKLEVAKPRDQAQADKFKLILPRAATAETELKQYEEAQKNLLAQYEKLRTDARQAYKNIVSLVNSPEESKPAKISNIIQNLGMQLQNFEITADKLKEKMQRARDTELEPLYHELKGELASHADQKLLEKIKNPGLVG